MAKFKSNFLYALSSHFLSSVAHEVEKNGDLEKKQVVIIVVIAAIVISSINMIVIQSILRVTLT